MLAGLPYTALRDAILSRATMVEELARSSRMCRLGPGNSSREKWQVLSRNSSAMKEWKA